MKLLLDTHTFIWFVNGDTQLSQKAKEFILNKSNQNYVSIASIWEMAIKVSLGKLKINRPFKDTLTQIEDNGFELLPIVFDHTLVLTLLEFHHRDPFDRVLIAQAKSEDMSIITRDDQFSHYAVPLVW